MTDRPPVCRCDTAPEQRLGRQFGIVSMGITTGSLVGPPVAGVLYKRWGFRAPFIFGIIVTGIDLLARLLLIERHEATSWGIDPMEIAVSGKEEDPEAAPRVTAVEGAERPSAPELRPVFQELTNAPTVGEGEGGIKAETEERVREGDQTEEHWPQESRGSRVTLLPHIVLFRLLKSSRAGVCIILTLIWGFGWAGQEAAVVLHLNKVWDLDPHQAGTAFIAAVVPTIFCEFRVFFSLPPVHPECVGYSRYPIWFVKRQVWPGSDRLRHVVTFLALVWADHYRGLSRHVPDLLRS